MTNLTIRKLVKEHKPQVVEVLRLASGEMLDVDSDRYREIEGLVIEGYELYQSPATGKIHMRVIPKI